MMLTASNNSYNFRTLINAVFLTTLSQMTHTVQENIASADH